MLDSWRVQKFKITTPLEGEITTSLIRLPDLFSYIGIVPTEEITISTVQFITYEYSTDGETWYDVPDDRILMGADSDTKNIQFRATLKREDGYESPALDKIVVEYVAWGSSPPAAAAGSGGASGASVLSVEGTKDDGDTFEKGGIYVFPNPARQMDPTFRFEYKNIDRLEFTIYNVAAEEIYSRDVISPPEEYEYELNAGSIPSGVYIYVVRAFNGRKELDRTIKKFALIK